MRSDIDVQDAGRSFIERARRAQIIECAIDAIAERGIAGATLAEIARRADVSKGVISYHFAGKNELIQQVVESVRNDAFEQIMKAVDEEKTAAGKLRAYISTTLEFIGNHRERMLAMVEVFTNFRKEDGALFYNAGYNEDTWLLLASICEQGQVQGEFHDFDCRVMAITLQAALDAVVVMQPLNPELDLDAYARELIALFERATGVPDVTSLDTQSVEQEGLIT